MLTQKKSIAILIGIFIVGISVMLYLTSQTNLNYHVIRGIVGLTMASLGGLVLLTIQINWWRIRNQNNKNKDDIE